MRKLAIILGFLLAFPVVLLAAEDRATLTVTGQASVEAAPDMATITLGVTQNAASAGEALAQVAVISNGIFTRLEEAGIAARDMQTSNLNLHPLYNNRQSSNNRPPKIAGFAASNMITVRVRDLSILGEILDQVAQDGANEFNGLRFGLQAPEPLVDQARVAAVKNAMARAALLADAAGVSLGPVLSINEHGGGSPVMMMQEASFARSDAMPIAAGELSLSANVNMVFAILQ